MILILLLFLTLLLHQPAHSQSITATWCIARSGAAQTSLQSALDYACGSSTADCAPIQSSGLCYLPNTLQAHASYAFNSFYQRSNGAPGSCDFGGTAVVTVTDPSYGSCTYPSSASSAGSSTTPATPSTGTGTPGMTPIMPLSPFGGTGFGGLTPPNYNSAVSVNNVSFVHLVLSFLLASCVCFLLMF
ncbi:hypothetical protein LUZ60_004768 [Juncus effusus]|nr:hypothetical protein LUZ60_004768 [Juncus effusus]